LRESFGLSVSWLARNAKIAEADILAWEKGGRRPPKAAEKMLTEISDSMNQFEQVLLNIQKMTGNNKKEVLTVVLPHFTCSEDLWKYIPEFDPLPLTTYNIMLERANKRLASQGAKMKTVYMLPEQYKLWRNENNVDDDISARARWIALQISESNEDDLKDIRYVIAVPQF
jgi:hypothetical protein